ncbi:hypothetical protein BC826DRAFT_969385 [Russula brevipes]|nr:hypothetical protein BC826DRAFT_969385 [Russula brevipes]
MLVQCKTCAALDSFELYAWTLGSACSGPRPTFSAMCFGHMQQLDGSWGWFDRWQGIDEALSDNELGLEGVVVVAIVGAVVGEDSGLITGRAGDNNEHICVLMDGRVPHRSACMRLEGITREDLGPLGTTITKDAASIGGVQDQHLGSGSKRPVEWKAIKLPTITGLACCMSSRLGGNRLKSAPHRRIRDFLWMWIHRYPSFHQDLSFEGVISTWFETLSSPQKCFVWPITSVLAEMFPNNEKLAELNLGEIEID